ncbi:hypothetical protein BU16DRAFT_584978 [Lophium mytilinum]|uniref:Uncharacterized protein n=1 Tax=Lophium mytilinum TaxID=390894 RepID=A0A6A6QK60_9PEZI|nr:hypothetical protein BU16DRAFT_584978 [Lophium mytilinum]
MPPNLLGSLPAELTLEIAEYLKPSELSSLIRTQKYHHEVLQQELHKLAIAEVGGVSALQAAVLTRDLIKAHYLLSHKADDWVDGTKWEPLAVVLSCYKDVCDYCHAPMVVPWETLSIKEPFEAAALADVLVLLLKHIEGKPRTWPGYEGLMNNLTYFFIEASTSDRADFSRLSVHQILKVTELLFLNGGDANFEMEIEAHDIMHPLLNLVLRSWKPELLRLCFTYGVDPLNESYGQTLLHRCFDSSIAYVRDENTAIEFLGLIIDAGTPINKENHDSYTAFLLAVESHSWDIARFLASRGANVHAERIDGFNAAEQPMMRWYNGRSVFRSHGQLQEIYSFWRWAIEQGIDIVRNHTVYQFGGNPLSPATELLNLLWSEEVDLGLPSESQEFLTFLVGHLDGKGYDEATAWYLKELSEPLGERKGKWEWHQRLDGIFISSGPIGKDVDRSRWEELRGN